MKSFALVCLMAAQSLSMLLQQTEDIYQNDSLTLETFLTNEEPVVAAVLLQITAGFNKLTEDNIQAEEADVTEIVAMETENIDVMVDEAKEVAEIILVEETQVDPY